MFVNENEASEAVQQAEDKVHRLSTAHRCVLAAGIGHVKVTTDMLVMVQYQTDPVDMKPLQPTTRNHPQL